ncbi:MAG TPA: tetratricopeptide repeat protein [Acidobacteriaceae bacterium]|nr:tetratricopeptide repeat protein [Acidobacteriaceae bacterium]
MIFTSIAAAQSGNDSGHVLTQARALRAEHRPDAAIRVLDEYLTSHPEDANALTVLAQAHLDENDVELAKQLLTKALASSPNSPAANVVFGDLLLEEHRYPEAMDRFETVLGIDLRNPEARRGELTAATDLAVSVRGADRPDAALKVLEHARSALPDDPKLLFELGVEADEVGSWPEARDALESARKLEPDHPDVLYALARLETDEQHLQAAEADFRAYLTKRPNDASAHYGLGYILAMEQRTDEAKAEFERSMQLQPVQTESYYELGQIELDARHDAQAEPLFLKVLARDPKHGGALTGMGILAFRRKDYAQAEQYLAQAEKTAPDYQPAHYYRGLALARLGQKTEADRELQVAAQLDRQQEAPPGAAATTPGASHPSPAPPP